MLPSENQNLCCVTHCKFASRPVPFDLMSQVVHKPFLLSMALPLPSTQALRIRRIFLERWVAPSSRWSWRVSGAKCSGANQEGDGGQRQWRFGDFHNKHEDAARYEISCQRLRCQIHGWSKFCHTPWRTATGSSLSSSGRSWRQQK